MDGTFVHDAFTGETELTTCAATDVRIVHVDHVRHRLSGRMPGVGERVVSGSSTASVTYKAAAASPLWSRNTGLVARIQRYAPRVRRDETGRW